MAYLFVVLGISAINALVDFSVLWRGILIINSLVIIMLVVLEKFPPQRQVVKKALVFTPSDMSIVGKIQMVKQEIEAITKLSIHKVEIEKVSLSKNEISVSIYYVEH